MDTGTRATAEQVNSLRKLAKEYLRDWSANYVRHADLAIIDWDGATAEFHLANFAARSRQQTAKEIAQKLREMADRLRVKDCAERRYTAQILDEQANEIEREYEVK